MSWLPSVLVITVMMVLSQQQAASPSVPVEVPLSKDAVMGSAGVASFELDWPEASVPHWFIEMGEEGTGRYDVTSQSAKPSAQTMHPITFSGPVQERIRSGYQAVLNGGCETKLKHLAKTGTKRIAYTAKGSDAWSSCTFNYSDDKGLMNAVAAFQAIAETVQMGDKLQHSHRYDRLGLDAEIDQLDLEAKEGHAIEMQNIAPVLQSIIDDERVIERARRKAARLLQSAEPVASSR